MDIKGLQAVWCLSLRNSRKIVFGLYLKTLGTYSEGENGQKNGGTP